MKPCCILLGDDAEGMFKTSAVRGFLILRTSAFVSIITGLALLSPLAGVSQTPENIRFGGVQSFGFSSSYSPDSSHILIGDAEKRRVWTLGVEYTRLMHQNPWFRLDYEGSVSPLYEESDPTFIGTSVVINGQTVITPTTPIRVTYVTSEPVGSIILGSKSITPVYALFGRQDTYAAEIAPLGLRVSALPHSRLQPGFAVDLGFVVSARDIPVDSSRQFNYMFALGPGIRVFTSRRASWRLDYIYRHTSNAGQGFQNPGVDQGVIRVTVSLHR